MYTDISSINLQDEKSRNFAFFRENLYRKNMEIGSQINLREIFKILTRENESKKFASFKN